MYFFSFSQLHSFNCLCVSIFALECLHFALKSSWGKQCSLKQKNRKWLWMVGRRIRWMEKSKKRLRGESNSNEMSFCLHQQWIEVRLWYNVLLSLSILVQLHINSDLFLFVINVLVCTRVDKLSLEQCLTYESSIDSLKKNKYY